MVEIKAQLNNLRIAPRKVRLVVDAIRGKSYATANAHLRFIAKKPADPLLKLLKSAFATAQLNKDLDISRLYVKNIEVNEGPVLKRFMPRAMGRAFMIKKRTSHIKLVLAEKAAPKEAVKGTKEEKTKKTTSKTKKKVERKA